MDQPALSAVLAADPNVVSLLLATHVPDDSGHCRTCRNRTVPQVWPCNLHAAAMAAKRYIDAAARINPAGSK